MDERTLYFKISLRGTTHAPRLHRAAEQSKQRDCFAYARKDTNETATTQTDFAVTKTNQVGFLYPTFYIYKPRCSIITDASGKRAGGASAWVLA